MRAWRSSVVNPSDRFEEYLKERVCEERGSPVVSDMIAYHFGYGSHGPARRGKRLRPAMVMRAAQSEGAPLEHALDAAVAIELLHNYSLVHDDIEDRDEFRHGRKTLWSTYGIAPAINAGDAMCSLSFLTLARSREALGAGRGLAMIELLHHAHRVMCDGQSLDLQFEGATSVGLAAYYHMIACKTGALFEASCALGALCASDDAALVRSYAELGRAYGLVFQVRDDLLGIWGSIDRTGKAVAGDLVRRKWTYPIVWALNQPASSAARVVADAYAPGDSLDALQVARVVEALDELGAREAATRAIAEPMAVVERHPNRALRDYLLETLAEPVG
jgi:geranylgeranyl diphosphate synthase type I